MGGRGTRDTRSPWGILTAAALAVAVLGGCSEDGISLPTVSGSGGSIALPSVSISLPSRSSEPSSEPDQTQEPEPSSEPEPTQEPEPTSGPDPTREPEPTSEPDPTREAPTETVTATATPEPAPTRTETVAVQPTVTATPTPTPSPSTTTEAMPAPEEDEDTSGSPWIWLLVAAALAAGLAAFLVPRSRRRAAWAADLARAEADSSWFAGELLPQLQLTPSPDALAGGWRVGGAARVAALEDLLTDLAASAPDEQGATRARELRDAVRDTRLGVEGLIASGDGTASAQVLASLAASLTGVLNRGSAARA